MNKKQGGEYIKNNPIMASIILSFVFVIKLIVIGLIITLFVWAIQSAVTFWVNILW